jgi:GntR family transcriptional regulator
MRSNILHGAYSGSPMPAERTLMETFGTSRAIIRAVLGLLREMGLIDRVRGYRTCGLQQPRAHDLYDIQRIGHIPETGIWQQVTDTSVVGQQVVATPRCCRRLHAWRRRALHPARLPGLLRH